MCDKEGRASHSESEREERTPRPDPAANALSFLPTVLAFVSHSNHAIFFLPLRAERDKGVRIEGNVERG